MESSCTPNGRKETVIEFNPLIGIIPLFGIMILCFVSYKIGEKIGYMEGYADGADRVMQKFDDSLGKLKGDK